eukprot:TRINITY_DN1072_c0_g1_i1.p1 TRINITY_DN1072_c0_g1~~TRINITY_DN1072_c0_g1_i1.p1  ORF type:complete len:199 (-),score=29.54 TRINITY_DN1072_c0_g1_i1:94-690(-)
MGKPDNEYGNVLSHRKLKHHEQKLLKKHDHFVGWMLDPHKNKRELQVIRNYCLQDREDYSRYRKIAGRAQSLAHTLKYLPATSKVRIQLTKELLGKLHAMGVIKNGENLSEVVGLTVASFARRRLPVVLHEANMANSVKAAVELVEQGHVRVGIDRVTDPAFLVPRKLEDYVSWMPHSKIGRTVRKVHGSLDDYDEYN